MNVDSIRSELQSASGAGVLNASAVNFRQLRSTVWKRFDSVGSCFWISSDAKIGSRYIQLRWHASHCSKISEQSFRPCSHESSRSSNGFLNGENVIACDMTIWSSSSWKISSHPPRTYVPVSRYSLTPSTASFHSNSILLSAASIPNSLPATSQILTIWSRCVSRCSSSRPLRSVNLSSGRTVNPSCSVRDPQCLSRIPGCRSAWTSGAYSRKPSMSVLSASADAASSGILPSKALTDLKTVRKQLLHVLSTSSGSRLVKVPSIQVAWHVDHSAAAIQNCENGSNIFWIFARSWGGALKSVGARSS
mmetsp:Transcript_48501/g.115463  ORF Transcript_48501/g.115463 Transcript_48501/m.115463 type:complete len:306 (-) Transcript_48501:2015-2932(-)